MTTAIAIAVIAAFIVAFRALRILTIAREAWVVTRSATAAMRDPARDDAAREAVARQAARSLFAATLRILLRGALALALALVPAILASLAGLKPLDAVIAYLSRPDVILATTAVILAGWLAGLRLWPAR